MIVLFKQVKMDRYLFLGTYPPVRIRVEGIDNKPEINIYPVIFKAVKAIYHYISVSIIFIH